MFCIYSVVHELLLYGLFCVTRHMRIAKETKAEHRKPTIDIALGSCTKLPLMLGPGG